MALTAPFAAHHASAECMFVHWIESRWQHTCMQVALLFLTRGPMPLEAVWREFLSAAALVEPIPDVCRNCSKSTELSSGIKQRVTTHRTKLDIMTCAALRQGSTAGLGGGAAGRRRLLRLWRGARPRSGVIAAQRLFSVYLHPPPGHTFPRGSIFAGCEIADCVQVRWAQWSVVSR